MQLLHRFSRDQRGVSAVEFAFIAPVLILIYFSVADLSQAMLAQRKVGHAASAIGDLVAQPCPSTNTSCPPSGTVTPAELDDIYAAASSILAPFSTTPIQIRVSGVITDASDNATVDWSHPSLNWTELGHGSTVTLPANLLPASQYVIMAEVKYAYNSPINYLFHNAINFDQVFYLRPRATAQITCPTCT